MSCLIHQILPMTAQMDPKAIVKFSHRLANLTNRIAMINPIILFAVFFYFKNIMLVLTEGVARCVH